LSITTHYSQWPVSKVPTDAGVDLAYNGN